jgi:hypothetical protein
MNQQTEGLMNRLSKVLLFLGICSGVAAQAANAPMCMHDGGFEKCEHFGDVPPDWSAIGNGYDIGCYAAVTLKGHWSVSLNSQNFERDQFGALVQCVDATKYKGNATLTGYLKTSDVSKDGWAGLWMRVDDAQGNVLAFDNMNDRGVTGFNDWHQYQVDLAVTDNAAMICFGPLLVGDGAMWADDIQLNAATN